jgi:hypothetical protein
VGFLLGRRDGALDGFEVALVPVNMAENLSKLMLPHP